MLGNICDFTTSSDDVRYCIFRNDGEYLFGFSAHRLGILLYKIDGKIKMLISEASIGLDDHKRLASQGLDWLSHEISQRPDIAKLVDEIGVVSTRRQYDSMTCSVFTIKDEIALFDSNVFLTLERSSEQNALKSTNEFFRKATLESGIQYPEFIAYEASPRMKKSCQSMEQLQKWPEALRLLRDKHIREVEIDGETKDRNCLSFDRLTKMCGLIFNQVVFESIPCAV